VIIGLLASHVTGGEPVFHFFGIDFDSRLRPAAISDDQGYDRRD
jgi:hypothetical protein